MESKETLLDSFDPDDYSDNELCIISARYWIDEGGYFFEIVVLNVDDEPAAFTMPLEKLGNYNIALGVFHQYIGRKPKKLPKGVEEEAWDKVVESIKKFANRVDLGDLTFEKLDVVKGCIVTGNATDNLREYFTTNRFLMFYEGDEVYIQLAKLLNRLKDGYALFNDLTAKELRKLLNDLGAKPVKYRNIFWLWLLPKKFGKIIRKDLIDDLPF